MEKFVLHVPKWKGELIFSEELLTFMGIIVLLIVGILFCFWGYKYFRTIMLLGMGTVICCCSFLLVAPMTENLAVRMFLTVSLAFLGVCLVYFLDLIFGYVLDKLRIRSVLGKCSYLLSAPLGAAVLGLTIYCFIWRDEVTAVCMVIGLIFQYRRRKKQVRFRSYNDLLKMERPADTGQKAETAEDKSVAPPEGETAENKPATLPEEETAENKPAALSKEETVENKPAALPKTTKTVVKKRTAGKRPSAQRKKLAWGVAAVVIGLGVFLISRASKGRD